MKAREKEDKDGVGVQPLLKRVSLKGYLILYQASL